MKSLTEENYYQDTEYISNTMLGILNKSPMHLYCYQINSLLKDSQALTFGSAYHCAVLEPDRFHEKYAVKQKGLRSNSKDFLSFAKKNVGKTIINFSDYEKIKGMTLALRQNNSVWKLLQDGEKEKIVTWNNNNILCKSKMDNYKKGHYIVDLKSTQDCSLSAFKKNATFYYHYDRQAAFYLDGLGEDIEFWFVPQEKTPPYLFSVFKCSKEFIFEGRKKYQNLLEEYKREFIDKKFNPDNYIISGLL